MMGSITQLGFGDPATWPACTGHPADPRTDDEAAAAEIEAEAAAVWSRDVADLDEPALIRNHAIGEAFGEITEDHDLRKVAELIRDRQYSALGILIAGLVEGYWERRCRETAEDLIEARDKRAAEDAAADRFYGGGL